MDRIKSYKISVNTHFMSFLICILCAVFLYSAMSNLIRDMLGSEFIVYPTPYLLLNSYIYIILLIIPISVIHELLHGLAYRMFGGKVIYGFRGIYAYTREISGKSISRSLFLIVLLFPLAAISVISLSLGRWLGGMIFILNLFGSSGDIYMAILLSGYGSDSMIIDRTYGFDVINTCEEIRI